MTVVGILNPSDTPDDNAVFTDLKTTWIILGLGHGHQDLAKTTDPTVILDRDQKNVTANAKLYIYNIISGDNLDSFHFHGDVTEYPITAVLFFPNDHKASTIIRGRFVSNELPHQMVVPSKVVETLLQSIFRIKEIFNTVFVLVGMATLLILGLIVTLTLRLRKEEIFTMFTIGSSKAKTFEILGFELAMTVAASVFFMALLYYVTGFFVESFITQYIL
jgi:putative ABC transport system permease protein